MEGMFEQQKYYGEQDYKRPLVTSKTWKNSVLDRQGIFINFKPIIYRDIALHGPLDSGGSLAKFPLQ